MKKSKIGLIGLILLAFAIIFIPKLLTKEPQQKMKSTTSTTPSELSSSQRTSESKELSQDEKLKLSIEKMSLEEKVGQLFLARVPEENAIADLEQFHLGGYLLFGRDIEDVSANQLQEKIQSFQNAAKIPLLIASDEEGGTVTRLSRNTTLVDKPFQSPREVYKQGKLSAIAEDIKAKSAVMQQFDIRAGLYPVADMAENRKAFIYDRALGNNVQEVSEYVTQSVKTLNEEQMVSTLKHFPGYGENEDSHLDIVKDQRSLQELERHDLIPFKAGIAAGADSIMVSHNIVEAMDAEMPASISAKTHQYIRGNMNFDGIIMTDDMDMQGLSKFTSQEEAALLALRNGNDLILSSTYATQIPVVVKAVKEDKYDEDQLNQSVFRLLKLKAKIGLYKDF